MYVTPPNLPDYYTFTEDFTEETEALTNYFLFAVYNECGPTLMHLKNTTTPEQKSRIKRQLDEWGNGHLCDSFYLSNLAF